MPQSVRDAAAKYLPRGTSLQSQADVFDVIFSFDVIGEAKAVLATSESGQDHKPDGGQIGLLNGERELSAAV